MSCVLKLRQHWLETVWLHSWWTCFNRLKLLTILNGPVHIILANIVCFSSWVMVELWNWQNSWSWHVRVVLGNILCTSTEIIIISKELQSCTLVEMLFLYKILINLFMVDIKCLLQEVFGFNIILRIPWIMLWIIRIHIIQLILVNGVTIVFAFVKEVRLSYCHKLVKGTLWVDYKNK